MLYFGQVIKVYCLSLETTHKSKDKYRFFFLTFAKQGSLCVHLFFTVSWLIIRFNSFLGKIVWFVILRVKTFESLLLSRIFSQTLYGFYCILLLLSFFILKVWRGVVWIAKISAMWLLEGNVYWRKINLKVIWKLYEKYPILSQVAKDVLVV